MTSAFPEYKDEWAFAEMAFLRSILTAFRFVISQQIYKDDHQLRK